MSTLKKASCGTMESSDAYMELEPIAAGVQIDLQSVVEHQFGDSIRALAADMLQQEGIDNVSLRIVEHFPRFSVEYSKTCFLVPGVVFIFRLMYFPDRFYDN